VGFVVDEAAMDQVFLRVLWFSPVNIFPPSLSILIMNRPVAGRSSKTWPHPIDMNNNHLFVNKVKNLAYAIIYQFNY
jgi:hypothetical protein